MNEGAKPIRSTIPGSTLAGIHYLSTLADAEALRQAAKDATHGVVLGGSFLGVEIATSLARMGIQVVLIEENELLLSQLTAAELSAFFSRYCAERGIELRTNDTVAAFQGGSRVEAVLTRLGEIRPCDLVVVAIGVTADIEFLRDSGIRLGDGILVNQHLETSVPGIFAAGDVANFFDTVFRERRRIEHWDNAVKQGRLAARNMLGRRLAYEEVVAYSVESGNSVPAFSHFRTEWRTAQKAKKHRRPSWAVKDLLMLGGLQIDS
jgi:NADPH-dependent 2,4-dienoyl-CoA reductase/sulfur reductase-like enzyme